MVQLDWPEFLTPFNYHDNLICTLCEGICTAQSSSSQSLVPRPAALISAGYKCKLSNSRPRNPIESETLGVKPSIVCVTSLPGDWTCAVLCGASLLCSFFLVKSNSLRRNFVKPCVTKNNNV